ncbi:MAG: apolipoprotein N-acyltransferase [Bacteroidia bacterium]|nr:apolipoprotein N-acyltransferase [Bacteroidia bacterium]
MHQIPLVERWFSWWQALPTQKPRLSVFLAGTLLGAAFPPLSLPWLVWLAFPLLWGLTKAPRPYSRLYSALLLWNLIGCYWLTLTALSAPNLSEAFISFVAGAAAIFLNPLLMLLPFFLWKKTSQLLRVSLSPWLFILWWGIYEQFHFRWELTWSWLTVGFAWSEWGYWRQLAEALGVMGLSTWTLIGAALVYEKKSMLLFGAWSFLLPGSLRLFSPKPVMGSARLVYAVQPNIDPYTKFEEMPPEQQVSLLLRLLPSYPPAGSLVVLPETAIPIAVSLDRWREEELIQPFWNYVQRHRVNLLIGVVGYRYLPKGAALPASARSLPGGGGYETYNAALLLRPDTFQVHIKGRLVPFVERAPYLELLTFLKKWHIDLGGGFGHFGKPQHQYSLTLYPDEVSLSLAICYESIFLHDLRRRTENNLSYIAIITNDGWWKRSSGYWQHLSYGRLTAQALGVSAVRSANTGVSALISSKGEVLRSLGYEERGRIEGLLAPQKAATFYYRFGEIGWGVLTTFACVIWLRQLYRFRRSSALSER